MRMRDELWQGYRGYWQNRFIHHHILVLGATAWEGYRRQGRGMVTCDVVDVISPAIDWSIDPVRFHPSFVPVAQVELYLQALELESATVTALLAVISTYEPAQAMVILVIGNGTVDINLLQNLAIAPADCHQQVQQRWAEFSTDC